MAVSALFTLLFFAAVIFIIVVTVAAVIGLVARPRQSPPMPPMMPPPPHLSRPQVPPIHRDPKDILRERFAAGEIDEDEFMRRMSALSQDW